MSEDRVEGYLKVLSHPVRRAVIKALAEKGGLSYTELMRIAGVGDSGTFAFHMRMLHGIIRKDPETGDYVLSEEGRRLYRILMLLEGREEESRESGGEPRAAETIVLRGMFMYKLSRSVVEEFVRSGRRIALRDIGFLVIDEMPPKLLDEVLERVEDIGVVDAPENLHPIILSRSRSIGILKARGGRASAAGGGVGRSYKAMLKPPRRAYKLRLDCESSNINLEIMGDDGLLIECTGDEEPRVTVGDEEVVIETERSSCRVKAPARARELVVESEDSTLEVKAESIGSVRVDAESSTIDAELSLAGGSSVLLESSDSNAKVRVAYERLEGESRIHVKAEDSTINIELKIPGEAGVKASVEGGVGAVVVDGVEYRVYQDLDYDERISRVEVRVENEDGESRVIVNRG